MLIPVVFKIGHLTGKHYTIAQKQE